MNRAHLKLALVCSTLLLGGCIPPGTRNTFLVQLDRTIRILEDEPARWRHTIDQINSSLPAELQSSIRVEIQELSSRTVAAASLELRCDVDFLGKRLAESLRRLRARLLNTTPPETKPAFCDVVPPVLDLNLPADRRSEVRLFGYDLDHSAPSGEKLQVIAVDEDGIEVMRLPEQRIGRTTHYEHVLNAGGKEISRILYEKRVAKLKVQWGGVSSGFPEIVVVPWEAKVKKEPVVLGSQTHYPAHKPVEPELLSRLPPFFRSKTLYYGDADFNTHDDEPMQVKVRAELRIADNRLQTRLYMWAKEPRPDHTTAESWSEWKDAYVSLPGWKVLAVDAKDRSEANISINEHGPMIVHLPSAELVRSFTIYGDEEGHDIGSYTRVEAHFNEVRVTLEEESPF